MAPTPFARRLIRETQGGCRYAKLPKELANNRCCITNNNDAVYCLRDASLCLGATTYVANPQHCDRATSPLCITSAPRNGRTPANFMPEFVDVGIDVSMLAFSGGLRAQSVCLCWIPRDARQSHFGRNEVVRKKEYELLLHNSTTTQYLSPQGCSTRSRRLCTSQGATGA